MIYYVVILLIQYFSLGLVLGFEIGKKYNKLNK